MGLSVQGSLQAVLRGSYTMPRMELGVPYAKYVIMPFGLTFLPLSSKSFSVIVAMF